MGKTMDCRVGGKSFAVVLYSEKLVQYNFTCALFYFTFKGKTTMKTQGTPWCPPQVVDS